MSAQPDEISKWVWLFSGYQQSMLTLSGCESVWRSIRRYADADMCIQFREWNTPPKAIVEFIVRNSTALPRIVIGGYSWGGDLAIDLCGELDRKGLGVEQLVLCDAVYRSGLFSTRFTFNPLSLSGLPKFTIPDNVDHVYAFAQTQDKPSGHRLFRADGSEILREMINCGHGQIDECSGFARAMENAVARLAEVRA